MKGINYITDSKNRKTAVVIDLKVFQKMDEQIEDLFDTIIAESRKEEPSSTWEDVKKRLRKKEKCRMYTVTFKRSAEKEIERLPRILVKKLSIAIDGLSSNPRPSGSKKLEGQKESLWRIRVGDYRIIYFIEDVIKIVEIRRVGHRKDIYR